MKADKMYSKIITDDGYIILKKDRTIDITKINVILIIAGTPAEFEEYKKKNIPGIHSEDLLVLVENKFTVLGIASDYIKVIGTGEKRNDFNDVKAACIKTLK